MKRYSMFKLYARELGADTWIDLNGDIPFAVRGTSPVPHYNTIHINHAGTSMHEYKIVPVPGAAFYDKWLDGTGVGVHLLDGSMFKKPSDGGAEPVAISKEPYRIYYTGHSDSITAIDASNPEWIMNNTEGFERTERGPIAGLSKYNNNKQPLIPIIELDDEPKGVRYIASGSQKSLVVRTRDSNGNLEWRYFWGGERVGTSNDEREIIVDEGSKKFKYKTGNREQPFLEPEWGKPQTDFIVELSDNDRRAVYYTCVYKVPYENKWRWRWDNETVYSDTRKVNNYVYKGNNARYKIGDKIGDQEERWLDDEPVNIYEASGEDDRNIKDGARVLEDGRFEFHRNNRRIGISSGNNLRNLPYGNGRWRATDRVQTRKNYREEKLNQVRRVLNDGDGLLVKLSTPAMSSNKTDLQMVVVMFESLLKAIKNTADQILMTMATVRVSGLETLRMKATGIQTTSELVLQMQMDNGLDALSCRSTKSRMPVMNSGPSHFKCRCLLVSVTQLAVSC